MLNTRAMSCTSHILIRCQDPRWHDIEIRDCEVSVSGGQAVAWGVTGELGSEWHVMCEMDGRGLEARHSARDYTS